MTPPPARGPEAVARFEIDATRVAAGRVLQDRDAMNLSAGVGVAVREFKRKRGYGYAVRPRSRPPLGTDSERMVHD